MVVRGVGPRKSATKGSHFSKRSHVVLEVVLAAVCTACTAAEGRPGGVYSSRGEVCTQDTQTEAQSAPGQRSVGPQSLVGSFSLFVTLA